MSEKTLPLVFGAETTFSKLKHELGTDTVTYTDNEGTDRVFDKETIWNAFSLFSTTEFADYITYLNRERESLDSLNRAMEKAIESKGEYLTVYGVAEQAEQYARAKTLANVLREQFRTRYGYIGWWHITYVYEMLTGVNADEVE